MNAEEVGEFEKTCSLLKSTYDEISMLSKKSPNDTLNKFKLGIINKLLDKANSLLNGKYVPIDEFTAFDADNMPTNSDVAFVCAQYLSCLEDFRSDNIKAVSGGYWYWVIDGGISSIRTTAPEKLFRKK